MPKRYQSISQHMFTSQIIGLYRQVINVFYNVRILLFRNLYLPNNIHLGFFNVSAVSYTHLDVYKRQVVVFHVYGVSCIASW